MPTFLKTIKIDTLSKPLDVELTRRTGSKYTRFEVFTRCKCNLSFNKDKKLIHIFLDEHKQLRRPKINRKTTVTSYYLFPYDIKNCYADMFEKDLIELLKNPELYICHNTGEDMILFEKICKDCIFFMENKKE